MRWHFHAGSWFYLLLANWPSKSSFKELQRKNRRFQPNGGWLLWLNKGVGQVFVVRMPLSEFTTCKPISLFQTNSASRGSHSKAFVLTAGVWEGWGTTEVPKCLIATNFHRSCPKWTSRDAYQRQTFQRGLLSIWMIISLVPASRPFFKIFKSFRFSCCPEKLKCRRGEENGEIGKKSRLQNLLNPGKDRVYARGVCCSSCITHWFRGSLHV